MPSGVGREPCYFEMLTKEKKKRKRNAEGGRHFVFSYSRSPGWGGVRPQKASLCRATPGGPNPTPSCVGPCSCGEAGGRARAVLTHGGRLPVIRHCPLLGVQSQSLLLRGTGPRRQLSLNPERIPRDKLSFYPF